MLGVGRFIVEGEKKNVCNLSRSHGNLAKRKRRSRETYIRRSLRVISKQVLQRSNLFEISTRDVAERTLFSPRSSLNVDPLSKERRERERGGGIIEFPREYGKICCFPRELETFLLNGALHVRYLLPWLMRRNPRKFLFLSSPFDLPPNFNDPSSRWLHLILR